MDSNVFEYFDIFLLTLTRVGGLVLINPIFSYRGIPPMVHIRPVLALSLLTAPGIKSGVGQVVAFSTSDMAESLMRKITLGLVTGCVLCIFFHILCVAGDLLDTVSGLAVEKIMGPVGGIRASILGQFANVSFYFYFFVTGYCLAMMCPSAYSCQMVPVEAGAILGGRTLWYIITPFGSVFLMVIKLVLPFVVAGFVLEIAMGVLVKLIPQIHVSVINTQCKILLGITLMMLFTYPMGAFVDRYTETMMAEAQKLLMVFG